jgi:hypothetical protein
VHYSRTNLLLAAGAFTPPLERKLGVPDHGAW